MSFRYWPYSLPAKASVMVIGMVALALILAEVVERAYVTELAKENIQLKTVSLLRQVDARLQTMAQFRAEKAREKIVRELMERTPDLLHISVYQIVKSQSAQLLLLTQVGESSRFSQTIPHEVEEAVKRGQPVSTPQDVRREHIIKVALPIMIQGEIRGVAYAEFWTGQFDALTKFLFQWSQIIRIGLGVVLVIGMNGFLYLWVLRPLEKIESGITSLRQQEWKAQVPVHADDEIGAIAKSFNAMADHIRTVVEENHRLTQALAQSRDELQHRVDHATAELLRNNESLTQMNEQLSAARREVVHHQRLAVLGQLVATIAHKIGTPLTAISGHLQLLQETPELPEKIRNRVDTVLKQTDRLGKVIQSLLNVARPPILNREAISLRVFLEHIETFFRPLCDEHHIVLTTECDPSVSTIQADSAQLQEVLGNLIDNAIDVMPQGGRLTLRVSLDNSSNSSTNKPQVKIEVTDTGPGISQELQSKIFDPFFTTKGMGKGTGLGLAIANEIVTLHGGTLSVKSEAGTGTSFVIALQV
ncbi:sensor histidine kinase [Candidatus Nitronereus thalassa]|uniref:histidine kinase n=1 Tax=Candidatus Nitronereus thalassa TaxID=3020898 RepID=A0ABU3K5S9_9BACT|nr:ATP-binding protein [Candidatus Nitronereus thalassa]MDT7041724.1 ATP-binding protein [Candidatus Nitronereus thalassa]